MKSLSVVIPAFNEALRLPKTLEELIGFTQRERDSWRIQEIFVVDDGSSDTTASVVEEFRMKWSQVNLIQFAKNSGKGAAVHAGVKASLSDWILIADADMATPWSELHKLEAYCDDAHLVMGSRGLPQSQIVQRQHWIRQSMGKIFNFILRTMIGLPFKDTQCGFKLLRNDDFFRQEIAPQLQVQRFAWDVELILALNYAQKKIVEVPVEWSHQEDSRVRIFSDSLEMLWIVLKLKKRLKK